jgi:hypothetical protein
MLHHLEGDGRKPIKFANFNGDVVQAVVGGIYGPRDGFNEYMVCIEAEYDPETDKTRAGYVYATTADFQRRVVLQ